jgi:hypothetical protein
MILRKEIDFTRSNLINKIFQMRLDTGEWPLEKVFEIDHQDQRNIINELKQHPRPKLVSRQDKNFEFRLILLPAAIPFLSNWNSEKKYFDKAFQFCKTEYIKLRGNKKDIENEQLLDALGDFEKGEYRTSMILEFFQETGLLGGYTPDEKGQIKKFTVSPQILDYSDIEGVILSRGRSIILKSNKGKSFKNIFMNPWTITIIGGIVVGIVLLFLTRTPPNLPITNFTSQQIVRNNKNGIAIPAQNVNLSLQATPGEAFNENASDLKLKKKKLDKFIHEAWQIEMNLRGVNIDDWEQVWRHRASWERETTDFLRRYYGDSFVDRFHHVAGPKDRVNEDSRNASIVNLTRAQAEWLSELYDSMKQGWFKEFESAEHPYR